jgi:hypothetical protein
VSTAIPVADVEDKVSQRKNSTVVIVEALPPAFDLGSKQGLLRRRQRHQSWQSLIFHLDLEQDLCWQFLCV